MIRSFAIGRCVERDRERAQGGVSCGVLKWISRQKSEGRKDDDSIALRQNNDDHTQHTNTTAPIDTLETPRTRPSLNLAQSSSARAEKSHCEIALLFIRPIQTFPARQRDPEEPRATPDAGGGGEAPAPSPLALARGPPFRRGRAEAPPSPPSPPARARAAPPPPGQKRPPRA